MLQEYYVDQQYKIINVSPLSKLLNNDAIALWIRHRTVNFTDTKMIIKLMKFIDPQTLFSIFLFFVVYFLTIGPILLIIISIIGSHICVINIDFHKHLTYLICAKNYITI